MAEDDLELLTFMPPSLQRWESQMCTTIPGLSRAGDETQGFMHVRQTLLPTKLYP